MVLYSVDNFNFFFIFHKGIQRKESKSVDHMYLTELFDKM